MIVVLFRLDSAKVILFFNYTTKLLQKSSEKFQFIKET